MHNRPWLFAFTMILLGLLGMGAYRAGEWVYAGLAAARAIARETSVEDLRWLRAVRLQQEAALARQQPAPPTKGP